jgi:hypothetical protein
MKSLYFSFQLLYKGYHIYETLASFIKQSTQHRGKRRNKERERERTLPKSEPEEQNPK